MSSLLQAYPALRPYTAEELKALSPDQLQSVLQSVEAAGADINTRLIQLTTQSESLERQISEHTASLQQEFGVSDLAGLEALRQTETTQLAAVYQELAAFDTPAAQPETTAP